MLYSISGHVVDITTQNIFDAQVIVEDGKISQISPLHEPLAENAPFIMPGFIDAHVHIESSMVTPAEWARAAVKHGTVGAICDPHEMANVLGMEGIDFMINN